MENIQKIVENWRKNVENRKDLTFLRFSMYYLSISLHFLVGAHKYKTSIDKNNKKKIMICLFYVYFYPLMFYLHIKAQEPSGSFAHVQK